eukprot:GFUD01139860.1.p1 GENE.GFUD01139860.1~~GFUD01139860.1.p1  ORF type:complete len:127 (-),score=18.43 GFUD01139860.1:136-516(-)
MNSVCNVISSGCSFTENEISESTSTYSFLTTVFFMAFFFLLFSFSSIIIGFVFVPIWISFKVMPNNSAVFITSRRSSLFSEMLTPVDKIFIKFTKEAVEAGMNIDGTISEEKSPKALSKTLLYNLK